MAMAETAEAAPKRSLKPLLISGVLALVLGGGGYYAASHGLIPGSELTRSPILIRALPELAPPVSHASLRQRLRSTRFFAQYRASPALRPAWGTAIASWCGVGIAKMDVVDG